MQLPIIKPYLYLCATLAISGQVQAGDYQIFGSHYAWNNNFGDTAYVISPTYMKQTRQGVSMGLDIRAPSAKLWGYPAICRGWHYTLDPTQDRLFPRQVSTLHTIPAFFSYYAVGKDMEGDFTYDLFFRHDSNHGDPQLEVMIWGKHNSWPIGQVTQKNIVIDGLHYDLWEGMSAAGYFTYSFVPSATVGAKPSNPISGNLNIDIKHYLDWLANNRGSQGRYSHSLYLNNIEAGYEVVNGYGKVNFTAEFTAH